MCSVGHKYAKLTGAFSAGSGQEVLIDAVNHAHDVTVEKYKENCKVLREHNRVQGVDKALSDYGVDVIMGPPTGRIATVAAAAGYPAGNVPLGYADFNGRPFGMIIVAPANREDLIIRAMSAWEATFSTWKPPPQLVDQSVEDATANTWLTSRINRGFFNYVSRPGRNKLEGLNSLWI